LLAGGALQDFLEIPQLGVGEEPLGAWGPFVIPDGGLIDLVEFFLVEETYTVTVENLTGADLGVAVHQPFIGPFQNRFIVIFSVDPIFITIIMTLSLEHDRLEMVAQSQGFFLEKRSIPCYSP